MTGSTVWKNVRGELILSPEEDVVFENTFVDKNFSRHIELVPRQYSGYAHRSIKGIGVVNCVYANRG